MEIKKVMIVEDEAISAMILETHLSQLGYEVIGPISGGAEAISVALDKKPNLILMDILLDDGIDGIEAIIEIHKSSEIPVIYISASDDETTYLRAEKTNLSGFITKPYTFSKLQEVIGFLLQK